MVLLCCMDALRKISWLSTLLSKASFIYLLFSSPNADLLKGSFYANPILDTPTTDKSLIQR